jgi:hypothetical protein
MSGQAKSFDYLPIVLIKQKDRSIKGTLPSGQEVTWPADASNKPNSRLKKVMVNCYWWKPVWLDAEPDADELRAQREANATAAFECYDFDAIVDEADGWDTSDPLDFSRMVYGDGSRYTFHVKFQPYSAVVTEAYAYNMVSGDRVGSLPPSA